MPVGFWGLGKDNSASVSKAGPGEEFANKMGLGSASPPIGGRRGCGVHFFARQEPQQAEPE